VAPLKYDIEVVGAQNVHKALAGIERRLSQHNATVTRLTGVPASGARRSPSATVKSVTTDATREAKRLEDYRQKVRLATIDREARERTKVWAREERQVRKQHTERLRMIQREAHARAEFTKRTLGNAAGRVGSTLKAVGTAGAAMLGIGGAGLAAASVADASRLDELVRRTIINATGAGEKGAYDPDKLRKQMVQTGVETGVAPEQVAAGAAKFVSVTGDIGAAVDRMKALATFSMATGSSMEELAGIAASLFNNGSKSVDDMTQSLAILTYQGKKASFELKDMAQFMPELLAKGSSMGLTGVGGAAKIGGFLQIAMSGTQNAAEAATSTGRMLDALVKNASAMESGEAFGNGKKVNVFTDKSRQTMRDPTQIIPEVLAASGGDISKLFDLFDIRGSRATAKMQAAYNQASTGLPAGATKEQRVAAGTKAVVDMISEFSNVKGGYKDIQADATNAMKSFSVQLEMFNTQMKEAVASQLFPELVKLAPELKKLIPYVSDLTRAFIDVVRFFANHPFASIGGIIAAQVTADIAKAAIGDAISRAIEARALGKGPVAPGAPGGGAVGAIGTVGAAAVAGLAGLTVGTLIVDKMLAPQAAGQQTGSDWVKLQTQNVNALAGGVASGRTSPEAALKYLQGVRSEIKTAETESGGFTGMGNAIAGTLGVGPNAETRSKWQQIAYNNEDREALDASIAKLSAALEKGAAAIGSSATGSPNRTNQPSTVVNKQGG
jgi:hypothetical protein